MKKLYSTAVTARGGRDGSIKSQDGQLEAGLTTPKELGGRGGEGTNPEQLFAAGYAACFESALRLVARQKKVALSDVAVTANVELYSDPETGFSLGAQLTVALKGIDKAVAQSLADGAHQVCPYSKATRGNIPVVINVAD